MGYHYEDLFQEHIYYPLKELMNSDIEDKSEEFINIIKRALGSTRTNLLSGRLLNIISNNGEDTCFPPDKAFHNLFMQLYPDYDIRKLEYTTDDGALIDINYHGEEKEL
jgi:hypothetical protein